MIASVGMTTLPVQSAIFWMMSFISTSLRFTASPDSEISDLRFEVSEPAALGSPDGVAANAWFGSGAGFSVGGVDGAGV